MSDYIDANSKILDRAIPYTSVSLTSNWTFKQGDLSSSNDYLPANNLPTEIFQDLLKNGKIEDPFQDLNELSVRWVGDETWTYRTTFDAPTIHRVSQSKTYLRFDGLDTYAYVFLNGIRVLESENMFLEHRVDVTSGLKSKGNILEIVFESARKKGLEIIKEHPEHRFIVHQTEISRGPVRKAQYHWGWDWGPILLSCGPWKPISLEVVRSAIEDISISYTIAKDLKSAKVKVTARCSGVSGVTFTLVNEKTGVSAASKFMGEVEDGEVFDTCEINFLADPVELWWPRGYGSQTLYTIHAEAHSSTCSSTTGEKLQACSKTFGFRKLELVQEPDTDGTSFYFRVNNIDIFIGGSCWISADSFLTRADAETYRSWVELAAKGNQTMLRVWGGGIYEADAFYNAADELGILVWQDFMFACANYPAHEKYLKSVEEEARQNIRRLRHHPSLVIWAGNNEDYQIVERYGLEYDAENKDPQSWLKTNFPARYIYEHLLPTITNEESPNAIYHPSSPFGNGKSTTLIVDPTVGDIHQWNVWHGTMEPYQRLPQLGGRFVSEFGMEAYPHTSTLEKCITRDDDRYPGSMFMDFRNKAIGHERRLVSYVTENFRMRHDLDNFTHLTQVMQADAMSCAYKGWRRQWGTPGNRKCGGILVWQLNDCWPTISWAVVDYYLVPKPAYYMIKRAMQPVTIGVQRKYKSWTMRPADELWQRDTGHIDMRELWRDPTFDLWVVNSTLNELKVGVVLKGFDIQSGEIVLWMEAEYRAIAPNATTEIWRDHVICRESLEKLNPQFKLKHFKPNNVEPYAIQASLFVGDQCVGSDTAWPEPFKYINFQNRGVSTRYLEGRSKIVVAAAKPVKGFVFGERQGVRLSDNGFDVMPGEMKEIDVMNCPVDDITWKYVGM
ncbi:glycoside hydrolase superfamily [Phaeosphaeriaceae sp. PMI808]|nr:glycoside hydrolase superfamily [Phaeosphaeriaceae sp. PMI808]